MLLIEKLREYEFSCSEQIIIDYILKEQLNIKDKTIKQISDATYTAPSTLICIAKKAGYKGWKEMLHIIVRLRIYMQNN